MGLSSGRVTAHEDDQDVPSALHIQTIPAPPFLSHFTEDSQFAEEQEIQASKKGEKSISTVQKAPDNGGLRANFKNKVPSTLLYVSQI